MDLLYTLTSALPLGIGLLLSFHYLKKKNRTLYYRNLFASIFSGMVILLLLYEALFGDYLSKSSTAAVIFFFAPIYGTVAYFVGYGLTMLATDKTEASKAFLLVDRLMMIVPIVMFLVLTMGIIFKI